jgi:hypothetical protein
MKIKLDENLPHQLAALLADLGHQVHTVFEERLVGRDDMDIGEAAQRESRFLITQDLDFSDARRFAPGSTMAFCWCVFVRQAARISLIESRSYSAKKLCKSGTDVLSCPRSAKFEFSSQGAVRTFEVSWRQCSRLFFETFREAEFS